MPDSAQRLGIGEDLKAPVAIRMALLWRGVSFLRYDGAADEYTSAP